MYKVKLFHRDFGVYTREFHGSPKYFKSWLQRELGSGLVVLVKTTIVYP